MKYLLLLIPFLLLSCERDFNVVVEDEKGKLWTLTTVYGSYMKEGDTVVLEYKDIKQGYPPEFYGMYKGVMPDDYQIKSASNEPIKYTVNVVYMKAKVLNVTR